MLSIMLMATANIKKRLTQTCLIALTILLSSVLLTTAVGTLINTKDPFNQMFENQNVSHITIQIEGQRVYDTQNVYEWWKNNEETSGTVKANYYKIGGEVNHNGTIKPMGELLIAEHPLNTFTQDKLVVVEGEIVNRPKKNEVWIPTGFANSWGINVGDTFEISVRGYDKELIVSAIIVDPQYSSPIMSPIRIWVESGFLGNFGITPEQLNTVIGIRFNDFSQYENAWLEFEEYLGMPFVGLKIEYTTLEYSYNLIQNIVAIVLLLFSIIIIIVSVFVIAFTISNAVINDYKIIGILKAQGFSVNQVKGIYLMQYIFITILSIPIGIILSRPIINLIMSQMIKSLGIAELNPSMLVPAIITFITIITLVFLTAYFSSNKAGKIKPAQAIRMVGPTKEVKGKSFDISKYKALPVPILLGFKSIFTGKRQSLFVVVSALVLTMVLAFSVNLYNSITNMHKNFAFWGFDSSDILITRIDDNSMHSHEDILDFINKDDRVNVAMSQNVIVNVAIPAQDGLSSQNLLGFTYAGDMDTIGVQNIVGRNPRYRNEVSLTYLTAKKYNKGLGDTIDIFIEGKKGTYIITGIYQSISFMGWGIRVQEEVVRNINPDFVEQNYSIRLNEGVDQNKFVDDMRRVFGDSFNIRTTEDSGFINLSQLTSSIALVALLLSGTFILIAVVIIFNSTLMEIYRDKKSYGIFKALGMTPFEIRSLLGWKIFILGLIGTLLGLPLALSLSPNLLGKAMANMGMVMFPFHISLIGTIAVIPVAITVLLLSAWIPSRRILNFSPRNLIIE